MLWFYWKSQWYFYSWMVNSLLVPSSCQEGFSNYSYSHCLWLQLPQELFCSKLEWLFGSGTPFLNDLCSILLHFRLRDYALSADIEKVFLHVRLHENDRNFTCFLWLLHPENPFRFFVLHQFHLTLLLCYMPRFICTYTCMQVLILSFWRHSMIYIYIYIYIRIYIYIYMDNIIFGCDTEAQLVE